MERVRMPPTIAPATPIARSIHTPYPFPSRLLPASHPAARPTKIQITICMFSPLPRTCEEKSGKGSAPALFRKVSAPQPKTALSGEKPATSGSDRGGHLLESGVGNHVGMDAQR